MLARRLFIHKGERPVRHLPALQAVGGDETVLPDCCAPRLDDIVYIVREGGLLELRQVFVAVPRRSPRSVPQR